MENSPIKEATPSNVYTDFVDSGSRVPKPEEVYILPVSFVKCMREIAPKLKASGAWWAFGGDLAEKFAGVTVIPKEVEILTNMDGIDKIHAALSEYKPTPVTLFERKLEREAEIDSKSYPVLARSHRITLEVRGVPVVVDGEYHMKVGDWDWGDSLEFKPSVVNVVGIELPVMPVRLSGEIYITLGWLDRSQMVSDAISHAHHAMGQYGNELGGYQEG
ncbi:MAG: hypothetical protein OK474_09285 [Thaumarchaeota archaeon]|nr:hypothetical protein [Nitrososphaerota archaeon]